jgi:hypothetical protein
LSQKVFSACTIDLDTIPYHEISIIKEQCVAQICFMPLPTIYFAFIALNIVITNIPT